ncbi:MAG: class II aldolase/adducin family protein [Proteobacteria bacterium]|nr:class II aldolase/adducin family protein [Burkholderiales bacterium]
MNHPATPEIASSLRARVSPEEWTARVDLAACHRLLAHYGANDLTYNHLSMRVPGEPDHLLIKNPTMMFEEVTASSLLKFDFDGNPLQDSARLRGGGLVIHAGVLAARGDLNAVFHTHTAANMGVSSQKHGLLMINQHAATFYGRIAYHTFGGFEFNMDQRAPLLASLGAHDIMLLRNHGALVCARSVQDAFFEHHFLETACVGQIAALAGGAEYTLIDEAVCAHALVQAQGAERLGNRAKNWSACLRQAERLDPSFRE